MQTHTQQLSDELYIGNLQQDPITDTKVELARQLFVSLETQVQLADRKVQAVFGLNAFLVAALSLQNQQSLEAIANGQFNFTVATDLVIKVALLGCVCMATWSALRALSPRVKEVPTNQVNAKKSLFFFGDIHTQSLQQFTSAFIRLNNEEAVLELLSSSHSISAILSVKYKMLGRSTLMLSLALLLWILLQVNKFLG